MQSFESYGKWGDKIIIQLIKEKDIFILLENGEIQRRGLGCRVLMFCLKDGNGYYDFWDVYEG